MGLFTLTEFADVFSDFVVPTELVVSSVLFVATLVSREPGWLLWTRERDADFLLLSDPLCVNICRMLEEVRSDHCRVFLSIGGLLRSWNLPELCLPEADHGKSDGKCSPEVVVFGRRATL